MGWMTGVQFLEGDFSLCHDIQSDSGAYPTSHLIGSGGSLYLIPCEESGWGMKLTTHFHLQQRLRMCGAISPLP